MADVQLEHGFYKLANALDEALIYAKFSGVQSKIVRAIIRLTFGWSRKVVRISAGELAERCNTSPTGGFRRELDKLIAEGVIIEVERGHGRTPASYALNKNFETWGKLSVPAKALERLYGTRPSTPSIDRVPQQGLSTAPPPSHQSAPLGADKGAPNGDSAETLIAPVGNIDCPPRELSRPNRGNRISVSPNENADLGPPKDIEIQERQLLLQRADKFADRLVGAANNANAERYGEWTRTRPYHHSTATQLCVELLQIGVEPDLACRSVAGSIRSSKKPEPARTITYFEGVITDAHRAAEQRVRDTQNPAPPKRDTGPTRLAVKFDRHKVVVTGREDETRRLQRNYADAQREIGIAWGKDPDNAAEYARILTALNTEMAAVLDMEFGQRMRDKALVVRCAEAAGFPTFEVWSATALAGKS
jgi:phage replication O-like protein O